MSTSNPLVGTWIHKKKEFAFYFYSPPTAYGAVQWKLLEELAKREDRSWEKRWVVDGWVADGWKDEW